jgi:hypothetical protein
MVLGIVAFLVGCGPSRPANQHVAVSRVRAYHSLQELNQEAIAVVRVTAMATRSLEQVGGVPYTITPVHVDQVLRGSVDGSTILLRQMGSPSGHTVIEDVPPLVQAGKSYVVFLSRFTYGPGRDTDQYIPVGGGPGLFSDQRGTLSPLDPASPDLPKTVTLASLQQQISK